MERLTVEMVWEVPNKCTSTQKKQLRNMIDEFMNVIAEQFAWDEEAFSIEGKTSNNNNFLLTSHSTSAIM